MSLIEEVEDKLEEEEESLYRKLQQHLDKMPVGFPPTESGVEIRILKHLFTLEDAKLALNLGLFPEKLNKIYRRLKSTGISKEELEERLDDLVNKGLILGGAMLKSLGEGKFYGLCVYIAGIFEYQVNRLSKEFMEDYEEYLYNEFLDEYLNPKTPFQFRTVPVEQSIQHEQVISTYDDVRQLIEISEGPFGISNCICKQGKDVLGQKCVHTDLREVCMQLEEMALHYSNLGIGHIISKEEALDILRATQDAGLILQPHNCQNPMAICACCGDCCQIITSLKMMPKPAEMISSNYFAEVDVETCDGCETCITRCHMEALSMVDDISHVNLDRCIGCGNCVVTCPSNSIHLIKKEIETVPPKDAVELLMQINVKKLGS